MESRKNLPMYPCTPQIKAVVYVSASVQPMNNATLERLLIEARQLNAQSGVTGALIHCDGIFMQYFEGEFASVEETYQRILRSRQHSRVVELMNEPVSSREFPDWQMALAQPSRSELLAISTANWLMHSVRSGARGGGSVGMRLLRNFWLRRMPIA